MRGRYKSDHALILTTFFYLRPGCTICVIRGVPDGNCIVFHATIKAQWSNRCFVVLLNHTELHFLFCPSADCAMLFGVYGRTKRRLSEALDQTDDRDYEETEDEELHWSTSLITRKVACFPTELFFFLSSNPVIFPLLVMQHNPST